MPMYASDDEEDDWLDDDDSEEDVAMLTLPMILFSGIDEDQPDMQELTKDPETMSQMAQTIEKNIVELFFISHQWLKWWVVMKTRGRIKYALLFTVLFLL